MRSRSSQIMLFVIFGVIMLIASFLILFLIKQDVEHESASDSDKQILSSIDTNVIKYYIQTCLDQATMDALYIAGMQGGTFFNDQVMLGTDYRGPPDNPYGEYVLPFYDGNKTYNVTYVIQPRSEPNTQDYLFRYPLTEGISNNYPFGDYKHGMAGIFSALPSLCLTNGSNKDTLEGAQYSCETYSRVRAIQRYLQDYILNKTFACLAKEGFRKKMDPDIIYLDRSAAEVTVLFGEDNVLSFLDLPVMVRLENIESERVLNLFISDVPIRFKKIYDLAFRLIEEETKNIFHNLFSSDDYFLSCMDFSDSSSRRDVEVDCYREGMRVQVIKDACISMENRSGLSYNCTAKGNHSTFLVIEDNQSTAILNQPFQFIVAVGNRAPILEVMNYRDFNATHRYTEYLNQTYNLSSQDTTPWILYNQTITPINLTDDHNILIDFDRTLYLIPMGVDPDEDNDRDNRSYMVSHYSYAGWLVNATIGINVWEDSYGYLEGIPPRAGFDPVRGKDAHHEMNRSYVGEHKIIVSLYDDLYSARRTLDVQVRCYDELYGHPIGEPEQRHFIGRWKDGDVFISDDENVYVYGDYNFSNPSDPDRNDTNDCCNEAGGYVWESEGHTCDRCHRCSSEGDCLVNTSISVSESDCGKCWSCTADGNCTINDTQSSSCNTYFGGTGMCCNGNCVDTNIPTDLELFNWTHNNDLLFVLPGSGYNGSENNNTWPTCWNQTPSCIMPSDVTGHYPVMEGSFSYKPLINTTSGACQVTPGVSGRCIKGICKT